VKGNNEDFLTRTLKYAQRQKWPSLLKAFHTAVAKVWFSPRCRSCCVKMHITCSMSDNGALAIVCHNVWMMLNLQANLDAMQYHNSGARAA